MTHRGEALWDLYAPDASPWSAWAKPVLFAQMSRTHVPDGARLASVDASWAPEAGRGSAVVVDLDGAVSVAAGVALAGRGYRPVPLFNGTHGADAVIDVAPILVALELAADALREARLSPDAPPAFLLDARRHRRRPTTPGDFDNRWVVFPQDFPSGTLLRSRRIDDAVVWTEADHRPAGDLQHVLRAWQEAGVRIRHHAFGKDVEPYSVPRPSHFRVAWYRVLALAGLGRAAVGGFGTRLPLLPEPGPGRSGFYG